MDAFFAKFIYQLLILFKTPRTPWCCMLLCFVLYGLPQPLYHCCHIVNQINIYKKMSDNATCQSPAASHRSSGSSAHMHLFTYWQWGRERAGLETYTAAQTVQRTGFEAVPSSWIRSWVSGVESAGSAFCSRASVLSIFPWGHKERQQGLDWHCDWEKGFVSALRKM